MSLPSHISRTLADHARIMNSIRHHPEVRDLDPTMALILAYIGEGTLFHDQITRSGLFGTNVSYSLRNLEAKGYIRGQEDKQDRRRRAYCATSSGIALARQIEALVSSELRDVA
jgi:DNA-binding MarR family transcriptional regulator